MEDAPLDVTGANVEVTWYRSPISRDAVVRVVEASGGAAGAQPGRSRGAAGAQPQHLEAAYLTVARVADLIMHQAVRPNPVTDLEARDLGGAFIQMSKLLLAQVGRPHGPPALPIDWFQQMLAWLPPVETPAAKRGAPAKEFDLFTYPMLLALYRMLSGAEPAATAGGPTERFLVSFFSEMRSGLAGTTFAEPEAGQRVKARFTMPTNEAIRMKIRRMKDASAQNDALLDFFWQNFAASLAKRAASAEETMRH